MGKSKNNESISVNDDISKGEAEDCETSENVIQEIDSCQRLPCWCKLCNPWKFGPWLHRQATNNSEITKKDKATPTSHNNLHPSQGKRCWCQLCDPTHLEAAPTEKEAPEVDYCQRNSPRNLCWCSFCNPWKAGSWLYSHAMGKVVKDSSQSIRCWCKFCFPRTDKDGEPASNDGVLEVDICQLSPCSCNSSNAGSWQSPDEVGQFNQAEEDVLCGDLDIVDSDLSPHYCSRYCDLERSQDGEYTCRLTNETTVWVPCFGI